MSPSRSSAEGQQPERGRNQTHHLSEDARIGYISAAQYGYGLLWTSVWQSPLLYFTQEAVARIGAVRGNVRDRSADQPAVTGHYRGAVTIVVSASQAAAVRSGGAPHIAG